MGRYHFWNNTQYEMKVKVSSNLINPTWVKIPPRGTDHSSSRGDNKKHLVNVSGNGYQKGVYLEPGNYEIYLTRYGISIKTA